MLEIANLNVTIVDEKQKERPILQGLNLTMNPGEVHAIMGPNGSGKSTLLNVLAGRRNFQVLNGSVHLNNEDLLKLEPEERALRGLFLAFQYPTEISGVGYSHFLRNAYNLLTKSLASEQKNREVFITVKE